VRIEEALRGLEVSLEEELLPSLLEGLKVKRENFGEEVFLFAPGFKHYETEDFPLIETPKFVDVSITGRNCELMCEHCASKILWHMIPATTPEELFEVARRLKEQGVEGILVSGGSDRNGFVPLRDFFPVMKRIKEELGLSVSCHVGLVDEEFAEGLAEAQVEAVLLDVIGDDETIREVYHLPHKSVEDYERSLYLLKSAGLRIVPHIVIGLHFGRIKGEKKAIEMIARHQPDALVLVVIMPYYGKARFQLLPPPSAEEVAPLFLYARKLLPKTPVVLGCARPAGEERKKIDAYALLAGLNGIAFPAEGIVNFAREAGMRPVVSPNCCSTVYGALKVMS